MKNFKFITFLVLTGFVFLLPAVVIGNVNPDFTYFDNLLEGFLNLLKTLVVIILALALVFFLWGMATFILNSGSEEKREEGKKKMIWGIIILAVMVSVWGLVEALQIAFGLDGSFFFDASEWGNWEGEWI